MAIELWTSADLYDILEDDRLDPVPDHWRTTYFPQTYFSDDKEIKFAELPGSDRFVAPFVLPTEQGKPIMNYKGETVKSFTPPYIKPKDAVRAVDARTIRPSEILRNNGQRPSLADRFEARVVEVVNYHRRAIAMRIAHMCAKSIIDAKLTVKYERDSGSQYPEVTLDFGRDNDLNIVLDTNYWSSASYDILGQLSAWSDLMYSKPRGARPTRLVAGSAVAPYITKNTGILALLNTQIRGGEDTVMKRGLFNIDQPFSYIGTLGGNGQAIEIWTYKDQVQDANGTMVDLLGPKDVLLQAPGQRGVLAYGAIYDADALQEGAAIDIFPKMWVEKDPGDVMVMHQSAPLPVNLTPNRTLKATVLA